MANGGTNGSWRYVPQQWVIYALVSLLLAAYGVLVVDTRSAINKNTDRLESKVDRDQYNRDIGEIKGGIDQLIKMHLKE